MTRSEIQRRYYQRHREQILEKQRVYRELHLNNGRGSDWRRTPLHETYSVDNNGCWIWALHLNNWGYGHVERNGYAGNAHRWMWTVLRGSIPAGLTLDHLCRVRSCVNPDHLELVSLRENLRRGNGFPGINARKTHCIRGHPFDEANTALYQDKVGLIGRHCRACWRERYWARKRPDGSVLSVERIDSPSAGTLSAAATPSGERAEPSVSADLPSAMTSPDGATP